MDKNFLRKQKLRRLKTHRSRSTKSLAIKKKLTMLEDFLKANDIFIYISDKLEVDTAEIITEAKRQGKNIYCPVTFGDNIKPGIFESFNELRTGTFGIPEPKKTEDMNKFDLIIVPGVAFDKNGARIGRGGGHFDRFLAKTGGKKIALAFDFQMSNRIETEKHDMPVDMIITEKRIIDIKNDMK